MMLKRSMIVAVACLVLVGMVWSGAALAQRGEGRSTPAGGGDSARPTLAGSTGGRNQARSTPIPGATLAPARPTGQPTRAPFTPSFQATATVPFNLPNLNTLDTSQLPYDFPLEALQLEPPQSSAEAYSALVSFAAQHLGIGVTPLYAGTVEDASAALSGETATGGSAALWQVMQMFPAEVQELAAATSALEGTAYWGLFSSGIGMVMLADCTENPECTMELESTQINFSNLVMGIYGLYLPDAAPSSEDAALRLIQRTYPALAGMNFTYLGMAEEGYDFAALENTFSRGAAHVKIAWAGTVAYNNQAMVYVFMAVGDGTF